MSLNKINFSKDHKLIKDIIIESGKIAIKWFNNKPKVWKKEDGTKVSEADIEVNDFLHKELIRDKTLIPDGALLLIAVSGGQDSMALLKLINDLQNQLFYYLSVLEVFFLTFLHSLLAQK